MEGVDRLLDLFKESLGPETGDDVSYLVVAAIILSSRDPAAIGPFYRYLADRVLDEDPEKGAKASSQIRDVLIKSWTLIGIPPVITGVAALVKEDDGSFLGDSLLSEKWANPPTLEHGGPISERGMTMMLRIYGQEILTKIFDTWGSLRSDLIFLESSVIYGLYLADHSVLSELQSECVTLACMLCTGLGQPSLWHLRGLSRLLGARGDTVEENREVVDKVQRFADAVAHTVRFFEMDEKVRLKDWPAVADVEEHLGGFGNDPVPVVSST